MERLTKKFSDGKEAYCEDISDVGIKGINYPTYVGKAVNKLAEYEDLEEQGKLLKLPCAVDSEVWYIDKYAGLYTEIVRGVVDGYLWYRSCGFALNVVWDKPIMGHFGYKRKEVPFTDVGKTVFITQEEAEATLKEMME